MGLKWHVGPGGLNRYSKNISSKINRTHTLFPSIRGTCSKIDHIYMLYHKTSLSKFKRIGIISDFFPDHSGLKLEINYIKKLGKITDKWILNSMLLNNYWAEEDIKREIKNTLRDMRMETEHTKFYSVQQKQFREGSL